MSKSFIYIHSGVNTFTSCMSFNFAIGRHAQGHRVCQSTKRVRYCRHMGNNIALFELEYPTCRSTSRSQI